MGRRKGGDNISNLDFGLLNCIRLIITWITIRKRIIFSKRVLIKFIIELTLEMIFKLRKFVEMIFESRIVFCKMSLILRPYVDHHILGNLGNLSAHVGYDLIHGKQIRHLSTGISEIISSVVAFNKSRITTILEIFRTLVLLPLSFKCPGIHLHL